MPYFYELMKSLLWAVVLSALIMVIIFIAQAVKKKRID